MKILVLIAIAFTSSLFATAPAVQETPEHIAVSKDQIIVIEDGLFVAHDGALFPASALFHTDTGFVAEVLRERGFCKECCARSWDGKCPNIGCPLYGKKCY
ncbi:MAG: hypothetical protein JSR80_02635 [Verrucomicrobia bacterium]|nr:hypothetical protein [Verrucomicrobiota bacterium]